MGEELQELAVDGGRREDAAHRVVREQVGVDPHGGAQLDVAVGLEALAQGFEAVVEGGEVQAQHDVARALLGRGASDVGAVEHAVPVPCHGAVVVALEHRHPQALAEASWADEEDVAALFEVVEEAGLVDVEPAAQPDAADVRLAVGDAGVGTVGHGGAPRPAPGGRLSAPMMPHRPGHRGAASPGSESPPAISRSGSSSGRWSPRPRRRARPRRRSAGRTRSRRGTSSRCGPRR